MTIYKKAGGNILRTGSGLAASADCCCEPPPPADCCADELSDNAFLYWSSNCDPCDEGPYKLVGVNPSGSCDWAFQTKGEVGGGHEPCGEQPNRCGLLIQCGCGEEDDELDYIIYSYNLFIDTCACVSTGTLTIHSCDPFHATGTGTGPNGSVFVEITE